LFHGSPRANSYIFSTSQPPPLFPLPPVGHLPTTIRPHPGQSSPPADRAAGHPAHPAAAHERFHFVAQGFFARLGAHDGRTHRCVSESFDYFGPGLLVAFLYLLLVLPFVRLAPSMEERLGQGRLNLIDIRSALAVAGSEGDVSAYRRVANSRVLRVMFLCLRF
jgi:hypothetical protein